MKGVRFILIAAVAGLLGAWGWLSFRSKADAESAEREAVLRSRKIRMAQAKEEKSKKRALRVALSQNRTQKPAASADDGWSVDDVSNLDSGFVDDEEKLITELSSAVREMYEQLVRSRSRFDRKGMLAAVRQILAAMKRGESVPRFVKLAAVEGLKVNGGGIDALADLVGFAADADATVAGSAVEALEELLWDFDSTPAQIASAVQQIVSLSTDRAVVEPFVTEINDLPTALKVQTALKIVDSGNTTALEVLDENREFIFDDFEGNIQTRADIVRYGEAKGLEESEMATTHVTEGK